MEEFVSALEALNAETSSEQWPDAVVFGEIGVINYAVQFPGEQISGNWLISKKGYAAGAAPPFYVVSVICPTGLQTFYKMLLLILGRIRASTKSPIQEWDAIASQIPSTAIVAAGYQYNLEGELRPVPRDQYEDRAVPRPVFHITDRKEKVLAGVQFLPWQDGAVILTVGSFPVDMLLLYADPRVRKGGPVYRRDGRQISSVMPISHAEFMATLERFQTQSNMVVRLDDTPVVIQKVRDEGTSSPFVARIFLGLLYLRNLGIEVKTRRDEFDRLHEIMTSHLFNARDASLSIGAIWEGHRKKITSGECIRIDGRHIHITESIDRVLGKEVDSFLNASTRALKEGVQGLARNLNLDIGFLFQQQRTFEARVTALESSNCELAAYLRLTRQWSEPLIKSRIDLEHHSWKLPKITYTPNGTGADLGEPEIAGRRMTEFVKETFDRAACFAEEITAYGIQKSLPVNITLTEIPVDKRNPEAPTRFLVTPTEGGLPPWRLIFRNAPFETV